MGLREVEGPTLTSQKQPSTRHNFSFAERDGRMAACLKSHDSDLAPACHQIVDKVESAIHEARATATRKSSAREFNLAVAAFWPA